MKIPFVDLKRQYDSIREDINNSIQEVLQNASFVLGEQVTLFEENFAKYCGTKFCVSVASGTEALFLALKVLEINNGDEVITVPNTFIATVDAISRTGAKPIFVDINKNTYTIDISKIEEKITRNTKAIIPVHLYGQPADMDAIMDLAKKYNLYVIEDACQAHGAIYKKKKAGAIGDIGCFSFYPAKNLGAYGDGGAVVTNNEKIAEKIIMLRNYGQKKKYYHECIGFNSRLDSMQAAVLNVKLKRLDIWNKSRKTNADYYKKSLSGINQIILPYEAPGRSHIYHLFVVRIPNRNGLQNYLESVGISTGIHYPVPVHLQNSYKFLGYQKGDFPVAEEYAAHILSLPMFPELTIKEIQYICGEIKKYIG